LEGCFLRADRFACCAFGVGSKSYLSIPALLDVAVHITLPLVHPANGGVPNHLRSRGDAGDRSRASKRQLILELDQDGLLRPFDSSTVLWPAGYLLVMFCCSFSQLLASRCACYL
jgi:hypothetical protein